MLNFQYYNPARIVFGKGAIGGLGEQLKKAGARSVLFVYSGEHVGKLGITDAVRDACSRAGAELCEDGSVVPNPPLGTVRRLIETGRGRGVDFVLAAGGGAAIDTAKAVAMGIPYSGDVWEFFAGQSVPEQILPVGAITTIAASGSETSNAAIISNGDLKLGFEDDRLIPVFAIMDPAYTLELPAFQTAAGIADIYSHILERYFSDVKHTDITDYLLEGAAKALILNGVRVMENPLDYDARAEIQWTASIAHNNLLDTGRDADWGSHRIEHELSAQYGLTHGEGMAVVLSAWTQYAAAVKPWKPARFASRVYGVDPHDYSESEAALILSRKLREFFRKLGLHTTLGELGIGSEKFGVMAANATRNGPVGHYIRLDAGEIRQILGLAL